MLVLYILVPARTELISAVARLGVTKTWRLFYSTLHHCQGQGERDSHFQGERITSSREDLNSTGLPSYSLPLMTAKLLTSQAFREPRQMQCMKTIAFMRCCICSAISSYCLYFQLPKDHELMILVSYLRPQLHGYFHLSFSSGSIQS